MTFDPFCGLEIVGSKSIWFQWDPRFEPETIPMGLTLSLRGGEQCPQWPYPVGQVNKKVEHPHCQLIAYK
jgi:hypothetical protein